MELGILNALVLDSSGVKKKFSIAIDKGRIADIGPAKRINSTYKFRKKIDASKKIAVPGFVDAHMHSFQVGTKGLTCDSALLPWLKKYIFPFEGNLTKEQAKTCAEISYLEMLKGGTTCFSDFTSVHNTDEAFKAAEKLGIRANIGKTMMDQNSPKKLEEKTDVSLRDTERLIRKWHTKAKGRLRYIVTPRFDITCSDELLMECKKLAEKYGTMLQTHAQENKAEIEFERKNFGAPAIKHLKRIGLLGKNLLLAHCIWLDDKDILLLSRTGTKVVHCPGSNMILASGAAPIGKLLKKGIAVGLGSDVGAYYNFSMFEQMRLASLIQRMHTLDPKSLNHNQSFQMATIGGAAALGLDKEIGSLKKGKKADVVLLDKKSIAFSPMNDVTAQLVYSARPSAVTDVIIDGKIIIGERKLKTADEKRIVEKATEVLTKK